MRWTIEQIQLLAKRVYGGFKDEEVLRMTDEMQEHFKKYDEGFVAVHNKNEWAEVERLAGLVIKRLHRLENATPMPRQ